MIETTMKNLNLLKAAREREGQAPAQLEQMLGYLQKRYQQLQGEEAAKA